MEQTDKRTIPETLPIASFLPLAQQYPVIDVRTPAEYRRGHIPAAHNVPLFSDEERALIGTLYAQQGPDVALKRGLELVGPRFKDFIDAAERIAAGASTLCVYCWRGGMRSRSLAFLFELAGFTTYTLQRGYKAYRNFVLQQFATPRRFVVLGGYTGSLKTQILRLLRDHYGQPVLDLEAAAHHKGSVFGHLGEPAQPTQQQFENELGWQLWQLPDQRCWIEDESRWIGQCIIPKPLWEQMRSAPVVLLQIPRETRIQNIVQHYGQHSTTELRAAIERLQKRLGPNRYRDILQFLECGDLEAAVDILLDYYDRTYQYALEHNHSQVFPFTPSAFTPEAIAQELVEWQKVSEHKWQTHQLSD